jgi:hypothetical protein
MRASYLAELLAKDIQKPVKDAAHEAVIPDDSKIC